MRCRGGGVIDGETARWKNVAISSTMLCVSSSPVHLSPQKMFLGFVAPGPCIFYFGFVFALSRVYDLFVYSCALTRSRAYSA